MDNTTAYLKKELRVNEGKIDEANMIMEENLGISLEEVALTERMLQSREDDETVRQLVEREILEETDEDDHDEEEDSEEEEELERENQLPVPS
jgi:hypothetical protein